MALTFPANTGMPRFIDATIAFLMSSGYYGRRIANHINASINGYVYVHRLVMAAMIGRNLHKGEIVHHVDENKQNNTPNNLSLKESIAAHKENHRKRTDLRKMNEDNPIIKCACGCGQSINKYDTSGRPRKYVSGHWRKGRLSYNPNETILCACGCGSEITKYDKHGRKRKFISGHNTNICNPRKKGRIQCQQK